MEAGGRFVKDVEGGSGIAPGQLTRELHPLGLATRERGGILAQFNIAAAGGITAGARLGRRRKQLPDRGEDPGIRNRFYMLKFSYPVRGKRYAHRHCFRERTSRYPR